MAPAKVPGVDPGFDLPHGCPWASFSRPNIAWCEDRACAWIVTPMNTWSNVAYFISVYFMLRVIRAKASSNHKNLPTELQVHWNKAVKLFPVATTMVGCGSFAYHATYTWFGQVLDFMGMYFYIGLPIIFNLCRAGKQPLCNFRRNYIILIAFNVMLVFVLHAFDLPIQLTIIGLFVVLFYQESLLYRHRSAPCVYTLHEKRAVFLEFDYRIWCSGFCCLLCGLACSFVDVHGHLCDPGHWLQGHAFWHCFTGASLYYMFLFFDSPTLHAERRPQIA